MKSFSKLAYDNLDDFLYGKAPHPVVLKNGLSIGGGTLYPEINFTLPTMLIEEHTMPEVIKIYKEIITGICERARELYVPGFVAEIETLPPMTFHPEWGEEVTRTVVEIIREHAEKYGIKAAVRITPNDIREGRDLVHMWHGSHWDNILETFTRYAEAGAELLAIESVGGKEIHDKAVMTCDIEKSIFALGILGCRDMAKLWSEIVQISEKTGTVAAGDTACGFANTAMVLADKKYIPRVFAAVVRVLSSVRSLVAVECGAKGPHKDCGYEGVYVKAISGIPIAMEGRCAACAHLSPVGNVAISVADLWSNESVQHIRLLGGMAPTVSFEQLVFDCRLMNEASSQGLDKARMLRDLNADSDSYLDPQAYVLRPDVVLKIAEGIIMEDTHYHRTKKAAELAIAAIRKAHDDGEIKALEDKELNYLDLLEETVADMPSDESKFIEHMLEECEGEFDPGKYDMD